jgi:hypothetical protein
MTKFDSKNNDQPLIQFPPKCDNDYVRFMQRLIVAVNIISSLSDDPFYFHRKIRLESTPCVKKADENTFDDHHHLLQSI